MELKDTQNWKDFQDWKSKCNWKTLYRRIRICRYNCIRKYNNARKRLADLRVKNRIVVNFSILVFVAGIISYYCTYNLKRIGNTVQVKWQVNSMPLSGLGNIMQRYYRVHQRIVNIVKINNKEKIRDCIIEINNDSRIIKEELKSYTKPTSTLLEKKLYDSAIESLNKYWIYLRRVEKLVLNNKYKAAGEIIHGEMSRIAAINHNIMDSWIRFNINEGVGISSN